MCLNWQLTLVKICLPHLFFYQNLAKVINPTDCGDEVDKFGLNWANNWEFAKRQNMSIWRWHGPKIASRLELNVGKISNCYEFIKLDRNELIFAEILPYSVGVCVELLSPSVTVGKINCQRVSLVSSATERERESFCTYLYIAGTQRKPVALELCTLISVSGGLQPHPPKNYV